MHRSQSWEERFAATVHVLPPQLRFDLRCVFPQGRQKVREAGAEGPRLVSGCSCWRDQRMTCTLTYSALCAAEAAPGHFQMNHGKISCCTLTPPPPPLRRRRSHVLFAVRSNYEDGGAVLPRKHEFARMGSENWRSSREDQNGEDDEGGWRLAGSRRDGERWCPPSPGDPRQHTPANP